jgi:TRAP-type C4-dicarboxylate transport system substrate-binding protein
MISMVKKSTALVAAILAVGGLGATPAAAEDALTAVHAFPPFLVYTKTFLNYVAEVNKRGAGVIKITVRGGPEAIGMFQQPQAVRDGVVDMVHTPGSFYGASVPEIDAMVAASKTPMDVRANGGAALMDQIHQKRFNVKHLAWIDSGIGFHIYMTKKPKFRDDGVLDLSGVKLRDNPIYHAFFQALNATTASMKSTEVYSALEKGVVDATAWPSIGIQDLKWDKFLKYRVDPRFYRTDLGIIVNLDSWRDLSEASRKLLSDVAIEWEQKSFDDRAKDRDVQVADLKAKGMQMVAMSADAGARYVKIANDAAWTRMQGRLEKMGGIENFSNLKALYDPN